MKRCNYFYSPFFFFISFCLALLFSFSSFLSFPSISGCLRIVGFSREICIWEGRKRQMSMGCPVRRPQEGRVQVHLGPVWP